MCGVLLTRSANTAELESSTAPLRSCCDEILVVHYPSREERGPSRLEGLRTGLKRVPASATLIAFVDDAGLDTADLDAVGRMAEALDEHQAGIIRGVPLTDAVKRVEGDEVVGGIDRSELFVSETPQILRRKALEEALSQAADEAVADPATLMVRAGMPVEIVPTGVGAGAYSFDHDIGDEEPGAPRSGG